MMGLHLELHIRSNEINEPIIFYIKLVNINRYQ